MEWLVVLHVLAAVIGLGPAYAFPFLLKSTSSTQEMERALHYVSRLEMFPKMFGTIAVVSGLLLLWLGSYGSILQIWIMGTLILYVIIEVLIVGLLNPTVKKLQTSLTASEVSTDDQFPSLVSTMFSRVRNIHLWVSILSVFIFILMILKPR
ncbi:MULTISPECIES: DUF2269 family protein [unclassified Paenibacillus]|uniref:DUF2269 family protein n=1 Tax=unclassified Paenibacillus TaxID=185978 RepID=UPI003635A239